MRNSNFRLYSKEDPDLIPYACKSLYGIDNFDKIGTNNENVFILIIGNENYENVTKVPYAIHDSYAFFLHCLFTLGFGGDKIHYCKDVTLGTLRKEINWLKQSVLVSDRNAKVIIYYAGHGIPDEQSLTAYMLPVDGIGTNVRTGYSLQKLYSELSSVPAEQVTVFLDACFSGTKREGEPLVAARGVAIKVKEEKTQGNMVVLSAAQGDETAYPYTEKRHGLFTYYLLNKLQESKGNVTLGELSNYIISNVKKTSIVNNGKLQTPTVNTSLDESWKKLTLK